MTHKKLRIEGKLYNKLIFILILIIPALIIQNCSVIKTFQNVSRLKFKLGTISNVQLTGIQLSNKSTVKDFSAGDLIKLTGAFAKGSLPMSFTLNVNALNPNDGTGGTPRTDLSLSSFPWKLYIDNKETISGNISTPVAVPGVGETVDFPLQVNIDLYKLFKEKGYDGLLNLALNISELGGSAVDVRLVTQPTVSGPYGSIKYPNELTIIHKEYR